MAKFFFTHSTPPNTSTTSHFSPSKSTYPKSHFFPSNTLTSRSTLTPHSTLTSPSPRIHLHRASTLTVRPPSPTLALSASPSPEKALAAPPPSPPSPTLTLFTHPRPLHIAQPRKPSRASTIATLVHHHHLRSLCVPRQPQPRCLWTPPEPLPAPDLPYPFQQVSVRTMKVTSMDFILGFSRHAASSGKLLEDTDLRRNFRAKLPPLEVLLLVIFFVTMDSQVLNMLALIMPLFLFLIVAWKIGNNVKKIESSLKIPPGPWKLPVIGNIPHLVTSTLPHKKLRDLAKIYGPLMYLQIGEVLTIIVSSPEYEKEIMKTHDAIFASRPQTLAADIFSYGCTDIAFSPYGKYWRQLRKICTMELLNHKRVNSLRPIREEEVTDLVRMVASHDGSPVNLTKAVVLSTYNIISRAAFGMKYKEKEESISLLKKLMKVMAGFYIEDVFPSAKWVQFFTGYSKSKLEMLHRQNPGTSSINIERQRQKQKKAKVKQRNV
ncbi:hypothetical protein Fmac_001891 [Flemingia macrophylla]|uniref:Cytochrome P450 n=1 Tax=Flemingia macrophylla TaxID=520843 RepID=A0ABD1NID6_9FABA